jgi:DNA polymerase-3 subunit delta'
MQRLYPWHTDNWLVIQRQLRNRRLPHALLLHGSPGLGISHFAQTFARSRLCREPNAEGMACERCQGCRLSAAQSHPDFYQITADDGSQQIKIDQIRAFNEFTFLSRQFAPYKIGLISAAETLNQYAANSLLKTLEEPPAETLILLVTHNAARLPATIRSRCQRIDFVPPPRSQSVGWLKDRVNEINPEVLLPIVHGRPLEALDLVRSGKLQVRQSVFDDLIRLLSDEVSPVSCARRWEKIDIPLLLDWLMTWLLDAVRLHVGADANRLDNPDFYQNLTVLSGRSKLQYLFELYTEMLEFKRVSDSSLNPQLLREDILLAWSGKCEGL